MVVSSKLKKRMIFATVLFLTSSLILWFPSEIDEDVIIIEPWEVEYIQATRILSDLYESPGEPVKSEFSITHMLILLSSANRFSKISDFPEVEKDNQVNLQIEKALKLTLSPWLVNSEVLDLVEVHNPKLITRYIWRKGKHESSLTYWFSLAMKVDGVRVLVVGAPGLGLVEASILVDYAEIGEFDELAHYYLSIDENLKAQDDYRPVRFRMSSTGLIYVDMAKDWANEGYIIKADDEWREYSVRSVTRTYAHFDENIPPAKLTSIDFSMHYIEE